MYGFLLPSDPLATGVLVLGVGSGTKELQTYLSGEKAYTAEAELGFETDTLDMGGNTIKSAPYDHVMASDIETILQQFIGNIQQVPPIFSAIKRGGQKMYDLARKGMSEDDLKLEAREVEIQQIQLLDCNLPKFRIHVECGGGTYIRSLVRDIGYKLDTVATLTTLERTKQGCFQIQDVLAKDDWNAGNIYAAIDKFNSERHLHKGL
jgi:tRNA pseudouridine55 synthase